MLSVRIVYASGKEITIYATKDDLNTFITMMHTYENIKDVIIN